MVIFSLQIFLLIFFERKLVPLAIDVPDMHDAKEDNKLFKITYSSDSLEIAKKVCKFSKSLKIGCLILKK